MSPKKLADGHGGPSGLPTVPVGHRLTGFPVNASFLGGAVSTGCCFHGRGKDNSWHFVLPFLALRSLLTIDDKDGALSLAAP